MNPFREHPQNQGISYSAHLFFAMSIAMRLLYSVAAFTAHAVFPFISIRRALDLEATTRFLRKQNHWIESQKHTLQPQPKNITQWTKSLAE